MASRERDAVNRTASVVAWSLSAVSAVLAAVSLWLPGIEVKT